MEDLRARTTQEIMCDVAICMAENVAVMVESGEFSTAAAALVVENICAAFGVEKEELTVARS